MVAGRNSYITSRAENVSNFERNLIVF